MAPTPAQVESLYRALLSASSRFSSYNFNSFFARRTKETYEPLLAQLQQNSGNANGNGNTGEVGEDIQRVYEKGMQELKVLERSAEVNKLYQGPKLVVEEPRPILGESRWTRDISISGREVFRHCIKEKTFRYQSVDKGRMRGFGNGFKRRIGVVCLVMAFVFLFFPGLLALARR